MTTPRRHTDKAKHNEALLGPLSGLGTHPDWEITTAFYAAVHWIRAFMALNDIGSRPGDQIKYKQFRRELTNLKQAGKAVGSLASDFEGLMKLSLQARYDCYDMAWYANRVQDAKDYLDAIREHVIANGVTP